MSYLEINYRLGLPSYIDIPTVCNSRVKASQQAVQILTRLINVRSSWYRAFNAHCKFGQTLQAVDNFSGAATSMRTFTTTVDGHCQGSQARVATEYG